MPEVDNSTDYEEGIDLTAFFELPEIDTTEVKKVLSAIDSLTVIYFTIEYIVRFCCSPNKGKFFIKPMNLVDFLSILPYVLTFFLNSLQDLHILSKAGKVSNHMFLQVINIDLFNKAIQLSIFILFISDNAPRSCNANPSYL